MKSVLISIQSKWCELIASGRKTVEVRKTKPKLETPFKVYIYCTKGTPTFTQSAFCDEVSNGKIIGEFVCDIIYKIFQCNSGWVQERACISREEYFKYLGLPYNSHFDSKGAYAWHISDLIIYDEPRELSEFKKINRECWYADLGLAKRDCPECKNADCFLKRPPQSWCYVEERE